MTFVFFFVMIVTYLNNRQKWINVINFGGYQLFYHSLPCFLIRWQSWKNNTDVINVHDRSERKVFGGWIRAARCKVGSPTNWIYDLMKVLVNRWHPRIVLDSIVSNEDAYISSDRHQVDEDNKVDKEIGQGFCDCSGFSIN